MALTTQVMTGAKSLFQLKQTLDFKGRCTGIVRKYVGVVKGDDQVSKHSCIRHLGLEARYGLRKTMSYDVYASFSTIKASSVQVL